MKILITTQKYSAKFLRATKAARGAKLIAFAGWLALGALLSACSVLPQSSRNNLLISASEKGHVGEMARLIKDGADINGQNAEGWTPYLAASSNGQLKAMRLLLDLGARTDAPDQDQVSVERRDMIKD